MFYYSNEIKQSLVQLFKKKLFIVYRASFTFCNNRRLLEFARELTLIACMLGARSPRRCWEKHPRGTSARQSPTALLATSQLVCDLIDELSLKPKVFRPCPRSRVAESAAVLTSFPYQRKLAGSESKQKSIVRPEGKPQWQTIKARSQ